MPRPVETLAILLCFFTFTASVAAQSKPVSVSLNMDQSTVYAGDTATAQVVVLNADDPSQPALDAPPGVTLTPMPRQDSSSHFVSIINGRRSERGETKFVFPYQFTPASPGQFTLGPARVTINGVEHVSAPLTVSVRAPEQRSDSRLTLSLDHQTVYTGQPVTLTFTWYISKNVTAFSFAAPSLESIGDLYDPPAPTPTARDIRAGRYMEVDFLGSTTIAKQDRTTVDGQTWTTLTLKKILVPNAAGQFTLGPATVRANIEVGRRRSGFFGDDRIYDRAVTPSNTVSLTVRNLPASNRPPGFSGLVGVYRLSARLAKADMKVGDPVKLTVRVSGPAPIERALSVDLLAQTALTNSFRISPDDTSSKVEGGSLVIETSARPIDDHIDQLPALSLPYFDPELGEYHIASSKPQPITVRPTRRVTIDDAVGANPSTREPTDITSNVGGLAHNYTTPDALIDQRFDAIVFVRSPMGLTLALAPPATWLLASVGLLIRRRLNRDTAGARAKQAHTKCAAAIGRSTSATDVGSALRAYLHDRLDSPLTVSPTDAQLLLEPFAPKAAEQLNNILEHCDQSAFAGADNDDHLADLMSDSIALLKSIDATLRKGAK